MVALGGDIAAPVADPFNAQAVVAGVSPVAGPSRPGKRKAIDNNEELSTQREAKRAKAVEPDDATLQRARALDVQYQQRGAWEGEKEYADYEEAEEVGGVAGPKKLFQGKWPLDRTLALV